MMGVDPFVLWVHTDSGITDFDGYLAAVREMNGEYVMGGTGSGQEDSIVIAYMSDVYDLDIKYIPYEGGGAVARDLAGQQIMATVNNPAEANGFYAAGDFVPLLAFSDERMEAYPDVQRSKNWAITFHTTTSGPLSARRACPMRPRPTTAPSLEPFMKVRNGRTTSPPKAFRPCR